jgi:hypothetical protein
MNASEVPVAEFSLYVKKPFLFAQITFISCATIMHLLYGDIFALYKFNNQSINLCTSLSLTKDTKLIFVSPVSAVGKRVEPGIEMSLVLGNPDWTVTIF